MASLLKDVSLVKEPSSGAISDNQNPISFPNDDNIHFTGYVNFVNCKMGGVDFTGANTDFVKNFSAITGTHFIIKFNGVPKYEVIPQWDSENNRNVIRPIAAD